MIDGIPEDTLDAFAADDEDRIVGLDVYFLPRQPNARRIRRVAAGALRRSTKDRDDA